MERLTEKDYCGYDIEDRKAFSGYGAREDSEKIFNCLQKLGQLEDIEQELGIDLITLFKALNSGVYWKGNYILSPKPNGIYFEDKPTLDIENKLLRHILYQVNKDYVYLKDYGKTWALTREELK